MRQILRQDLLREIRNSFMRFISIAALIALGTSFFVGLKSAAPNILTTGSQYLEKYQFYDMRLVSTSGLTEEQVEEIQELDHVEKSTLKKVVHQVMEPSGLIAEVDTYEKGQYEISSGRAPKKANEILLDEKAGQYFKLGDSIRFKSSKAAEEDYFKEAEFKVVGFANSYRYLSKDARGNTSIGNGELNLFAAVVSSAFAIEGYNVLDIQLTESIRENDPFGERYPKKLEEMKKAVQQTRDEQQEEMNRSFEEELSKNEKELEGKIQETKDLRIQLDDQVEQYHLMTSQIAEGALPVQMETPQHSDSGIEELTNQQAKAAETTSTLEKELEALTDMRESYKEPTYELRGIDQTVTFSSFKENIESLDALGNILPIIFYFVACFITVSIITRMIEQERKQIGTLKALGVKSNLIIRKYMMYSLLSGSFGLILGILGGVFLFPSLLIGLYSPLYIFAGYKLIIYWPLLWLAGGASLLSIIFIPYLFYRKTLISPAIHLMRSKPPIKGKKILIERFPFIWERCSFSTKMGLRNIFRYKLRMLLLFTGIVGCMVLLVTGYGARNVVSQLQESQFDKVLNYDMVTVFHTNAEDAELKSYHELMKNKNLSTLETNQENWEATLKNGRNLQINMVVPLSENPENRLDQYIQLLDSSSKHPMRLGRKDVFITKKLAQMLDVEVNDQLKIKNSENEKISVTITRVVDNYYRHYVYLGTDIYKEQISKEISSNMELVKYEHLTKKDKEEMLETKALASLTTKAQMIEKMEEMTKQLNRLIIVVIAAAVILGLVVIYNLAYINILERKQELSIVYAMGYRPIGQTFHIFREMIILGIFSLFTGYYLGFPVYRLIMKQLELEFIKFPEPTQSTIFLQSASTLLLTFSILIVVMHYRIKQLDTLGDLKDRE
ncbi:FtsX-like permease family protein [Enterococcus larvae]|uniref:ABC transporter permease n=1 Tax=Enterococcus larvae TaxID=2794352 RepID=UPI003F31D206